MQGVTFLALCAALASASLTADDVVFGNDDLPFCTIDSEGRTLVKYTHDHQEHQNFLCGHNIDSSDCSCEAHPDHTHDGANCKQFKHTQHGETTTHHIGGDCDNQCDGQTCSGNGSCSDGTDGFTCTCTEGFTGTTCATRTASDVAAVWEGGTPLPNHSCKNVLGQGTAQAQFGIAVPGGNPGACGGGMKVNKCFGYSPTDGQKVYWEITTSGTTFSGEPYHVFAGITRKDQSTIGMNNACNNVMFYLFMGNGNHVHMGSAQRSEYNSLPKCVNTPGGGEPYFKDTCGDSSSGFDCSGTNYRAGQTMMFALDMTEGKLWRGINGVWDNGADPAAGTGALDLPLNLLKDSGVPWCPSAGGERLTFATLSDNKETVPTGFVRISDAHGE